MGSGKCATLLTTIVLLAAALLCHIEAWAIGASPINGGCYIAAPGQCKIHIDPFQLNVVPGETLVYFELRANHQPLYTYRTDNSNPPIGRYSPSLVMQDFAVTCGETYYVNIIGQDSGDPSAYNLGSISQMTCPASAP